MTGASKIRASVPTILSNSHLEIVPQSAIGLSERSIMATEPT